MTILPFASPMKGCMPVQGKLYRFLGHSIHGQTPFFKDPIDIERIGIVFDNDIVLYVESIKCPKYTTHKVIYGELLGFVSGNFYELENTEIQDENQAY